MNLNLKKQINLKSDVNLYCIVSICVDKTAIYLFFSGLVC